MKNILLSISAFCALTITSSAQPWANASLDINQVKALVNSNGDLFWDYTQARFEVPKGNGTNTILAGALLGILIVKKLSDKVYRWFIIAMTLAASSFMLI